MRKLLAVSTLLLLVGLAASAGEFSGHLMDTMCAAKRLDQAASHTAECMEDCARSGFGLVTKDGRYLKFNESGNAKALNAIRATEKQDNLLVKVTGELKGSVIRVDSITME